MNIYDSNYRVKATECRHEMQRIDEKIIQKKQQIERLEKKRNKVYYSFSWHEDVVKRLMKDLEEKTGLTGEIYGPFGMRAATSIYLRKDMTKGICEQTTLSIELEEREDGTYYYTGKNTKNYPSGSIGEINGMNHIMAPLPETIDEIVKVLIKTGATR